MTFDKSHAVAHASAAVDKMRRLEQKFNAGQEMIRKDGTVKKIMANATHE